MGHHKLSYSQHGQGNGRAGLSAALQAACGLGLLLVLLIMGGCGRHGVTGAVPDGDGPDPGAAANAETELWLDSPAPAGVDAALWRELTTALRGALAGRDKRASGLPAGDAARVTDFVIVADALGAAQASWSFNLAGDYNHNGSVGVEDLAMIAMYWNAIAYNANWQQASSADGNGDGCVDLGDITPLGQHFGEAVSGFEVQEADAAAEGAAWTAVQQVGYGANTSWVQDSAVQFSAGVPTARTGSFYRLVPYYIPPVGTAVFGLPGNAMRYYGGNAGAGAWPMVGHDVRGTYRSGAQGPGAMRLSWFLDTTYFGAGDLYNSPVLCQDGTVFLANNWLASLYPDGSSRWELDNPYPTTYLSPAIGDDGTIYCIDNKINTGMITAFRPDRSIKWSVEYINECSPVLLANDRLYVHTITGLDCFDLQGVRQWRYYLPQIGEHQPAPAVQTASGLIVVTHDTAVVAITADGEEAWQGSLPGGQGAQIVAYSDGGVAVAYESGIRGFSASGELLWNVTGICVESNMACASDDSLRYVARSSYSSYQHALHALSRDGAELWSRQLPDPLYDTCLMLDNQDKLYAYYNHLVTNVLCYDMNGETLWESTITDVEDSGYSSLCLGADSTLYLWNRLGLMAINENGYGVPDAPAPSASSGAYFDHVRIQWPAVAHADSYRIYRDGASLPLAEVTDQLYDDYGVPDGSFHSFTVSGVNLLGEGTPSAPVQGRICIPPSCESAAGDWAMQGHDAQHTYRSNATGPAAVELQWTFENTRNPNNDIWSYAAPVFGKAGTAFISSADGMLTALEPDGNIAWQIKLGDSLSPPAINAEGIVFCSTHKRDADDSYKLEYARIYAVNPNRTVRWIYDSTETAFWTLYDAALTLDSSGNVHCLLASGEVVTLSPLGDVLVQSQIAELSSWPSAPVLGPEGNTYVFTFSLYISYLSALDPSGTVLWETSNRVGMPGSLVGAPTVKPDGRLYVPGMYLTAFNPSGERTELEPLVLFANLALAADGRVFYPTSAGVGWLDSSDAAFTLASIPDFGSSSNCLLLDAAGKVYCSTPGSSDGNAMLYCVDQDGGVLWSRSLDRTGTTPGLALRDDGALFVTTDTAVLVFDDP